MQHCDACGSAALPKAAEGWWHVERQSKRWDFCSLACVGKFVQQKQQDAGNQEEINRQALRIDEQRG
jgi:hypothetical protein